MTRDNRKSGGGSKAMRGRDAHPPLRLGRLAERVRAICVVVCCALALQPSFITLGRGGVRAAVRTKPASAAGISLPALVAGALGAAVKAVAGGLTLIVPAAGGWSRASVPAGAVIVPEPAAPVVFLDAPAALTVVSTSDSKIRLSWPVVGGAASYRVERSPDVLSPYAVVGQPAANSFDDTDVARGVAFLYRVRAVGADGALSPPGPVAMATAVTFADDPLVAGVTRVNADHVNDLRVAVAGVRRAANLPVASWGEAVSTGVPVRAAHVRELRSKLGEGLAKLGLPTPAYTDATLSGSPNGTPIRKAHFEELRARARSGSGVSGSGLAAYDFASERLDPSNRTGGGGVDSLSRNFNWSLPLVSLPGRAGLDLGLSLTYNSLVWTRSGDYVLFDGDWGWPAPGFRLGFPVVQGKFDDRQAQKSAYLMLTPSGARVSLRQTSTPTVYEAGDSSNLRLTENTDGSLTLVAPGGMRMSYWPLGGAYKCTQVKDRNGNYITAEYNGYGNLETITDTLGREIAFGYYGDGYLKEITQTWHREVETQGAPQVVTETHYWARFEYDDSQVRVNFQGLTVFGPAGGQTFRALKKVKLADDSSLNFNYTTWGQVNQVAARAPDGRLLNYVSLTMPADETTPQWDCPRPTERRDWAAYWNGDEDGAGAAAEEAVTSYEVIYGATWEKPEQEGGGQDTGTRAQQTTPDGTVYKQYSHASGWDEGLTRLAEVWSGGVRQKWTSTAWTQDGENLTYEQNPRVRETNVYDSVGNRRRTEVTYTSFGLPEDVKEYDANATTVLRRTRTEYVPASVSANGAYTALRLIGLPQGREVYGRENGQEKLVSKVTYEYDLGSEFLIAPEINPAEVTQHDEANFGAGFTLRGNLCGVRRWDASDPASEPKSVLTETGYNTLGSPVFTRDALLHVSTFSYVDSDGGHRLAYPTKVVDPEGYSSISEYNYDTGWVTRAVDPKGVGVKSFYDSAGRKVLLKSVTNGGYAKWEYGPNGLYGKQLMTVDAGQPETFVLSVADGAGRPVGLLREHPGSMTGYAASRSEYDNMGRVVKRYNTAEVSVDAGAPWAAEHWTPAGEDATPNGRAGWAYAKSEYDWNGRVTREVNADGTTDRLTEYDGCGCSGGEVVTVKGELVQINATPALGRRRQKIHKDIFGRVEKVEEFDWDGDTYRTTTNKYDGLDRLMRTRVYLGEAPTPEPEGGAGYQESVMTYDGHGRLKTSKSPIQTGPTTYNYDADDRVTSVVDARGVTRTVQYYDRHLVKQVDYEPVGNIPDTPSVTYEYDEAGNRKKMTDGSGVLTYGYEAGRLKTETKTFAALPNPYAVTYGYMTGGALKSITDPTGAVVNYVPDRVGRVARVTSAGYGDQTDTVVDGITYRAWGAIGNIKSGTAHEIDYTYDVRGQLRRTSLTDPLGRKAANTTMTDYYSTDYDYYADGMLKRAEVFVSTWDPQAHMAGLNRSYLYDAFGRLTESDTAATWQDGNVVGGPGPYYFRQYEYDGWDHNTKASVRVFGVFQPPVVSVYQNGRNQDFEYDAEGNPVEDTDNRRIFDAAARLVESRRRGEDGLYNTADDDFSVFTYDGDGRLSQRRTVDYVAGESTSTVSDYTHYFVRAGAIGGDEVLTLTQLAGTPDNLQAAQVAYAPGGLLMKGGAGYGGAGVWEYSVPETGTTIGLTNNRRPAPVYSFENNSDMPWVVERDPLGNPMSNRDPYSHPWEPPLQYNPEFDEPETGDTTNLSTGCSLGIANGPCDYALAAFYGDNVFHLPGYGSDWGIGHGQWAEMAWGNSVNNLFWRNYERNVARRDLRVPQLLRSRWNFPDVAGLNFIPEPRSTASGGQQLSQCLRDALRQFFPKMSVQGKDYSPIDDARFISGIPKWVNALAAITPGGVYPGAITLGLYDINYDPGSLNLGGGTSEQLKTIIEEISHAKQFLDVWAGLKMDPSVMAEFGLNTTSYEGAMSSWKDHYVGAALKALDYKTNSVEKWAKNNANTILQKLVSDPQLQKQGHLCGFNLTNYTIEIIP